MKIVDYMKDVRAELKHVSWPTRKQAIHFTILVIVLSLITAYFLGLLDFAFTKGLGVFLVQ
ncbi:MAG: preprotein translocase subunit SecE [Patescibacteria group bacterium]